jgi:hypothetical protein
MLKSLWLVIICSPCGVRFNYIVSWSRRSKDTELGFSLRHSVTLRRFITCAHKIMKSNRQLRHVCPVSACNNSALKGRIFMKFDIWVFFETRSRKFNFRYNLTWVTGTSRADRYTFLIISCVFLLRMRNVSDKICTENQNTHIVFNNIYFCFRKSCRLWDNVGNIL